MGFFSDLPPEILSEVVDGLGDDLFALEACSQTCRALLPLCRKKVFRTIELGPQDRSASAQGQGHQRIIVSFGRLLDSNLEIANHVREVFLIIEPADLEDDSIPRAVDRLNRVQSLCLYTSNRVSLDWETEMLNSIQQSLSRLIQSPTLTSLDIDRISNIPISTYITCVNLSHLSLWSVGSKPAQDLDLGSYSPTAVPRLKFLAFGASSTGYVEQLIRGRCSNGAPVMDFRSLGELKVHVHTASDLAAVHQIMKIVERLEIFVYAGEYFLMNIVFDAKADTARCFTS